MTDVCNEPHPDHPDILCDKAMPCLGYHENIPAALTWDGLPLPEKQTAETKSKRMTQIASAATPQKMVGPPVAARITDPPLTPYAGTSGWSGSDTSRARAENADSSGTTASRQVIVRSMVERAGDRGVIWREVAEQTGWHHGTVSGALSVLHKGGLISRLSETRDGCKVYVLPSHVGDRPVEAQGRTPSNR